MKKIEKVSILLAIFLPIGGVIFSAASIKKEVELLSHNNSKLESKIEKLTSADNFKKMLLKVDGFEALNQNLRVEVTKIESNVQYNKALLSELNKQVRKTNEMMLESITETRSLLLKRLKDD